MDLRKTVLIDKQFQFSFTVKNLIVFLFAVFTIFAVVKIWEVFATDQGFFLKPPTNAEMTAWAKANNVPTEGPEFIQQFVLQARPYTFFDILWKPITIVLVLNILVLIFANIYYSHKIIGPIYNLKRVLEKRIKEGKIEKVKFRKGDAFQELPSLVNQVLDLTKK